MACAAEAQAALAASDPMLPRPFSIRRVRWDTDDTFTLDLDPAGGPRPFPCSSGQFNMLYVFGVGEVPISICGVEPGTGRLQHTTRAVGVVTRAMSRLKRGDTLGVRGPFGSAWPLADSAGKDVVFVAGGIGLAPLRGAIGEVLSDRGRYGRVVLLCGTRTPEDILYGRELDRWQKKSGLDLFLTVDRATGPWRGNIGVVTTFIQRAPFDPRNAIVMLCGPEVMMRFAVQELGKRGIEPERIFLSMERNMKCAIGLCGHCQFGPEFICKNGPVFRYDRVKRWLAIAEL